METTLDLLIKYRDEINVVMEELHENMTDAETQQLEIDVNRAVEILAGNRTTKERKR